MLTIIPAVLGSGCWDRRELDRLAIIAGAGIDVDKDGVTLTSQIVKPSKVSGSPSGGGGGGQEQATWVMQSRGKTLFQAARRSTFQTSRRLYWAHIQVAIFGEATAKKGLGPYLDFFVRDPEPRPTEWMVIAEGKASDMLTPQAKLETISSMAIGHLIQNYSSTSQFYPATIHDFTTRLMSGTTAPLAPRILRKGKGKDQQVVMDGTAVFKKDKMVGILNPTETRGVLWAIDKVKSGIIVIEQAGKPTSSIEIIDSKGSFKVQLRNGKPHMQVEIHANLNFGEELGTVDISKPDQLNKFDQQAATAIRNEVMKAWHKARDLRADVFGLGQAVGRKYPKEWKRMESRWQEVFPQSTIEVNVKANIRVVGKITKSVITPQ